MSRRSSSSKKIKQCIKFIFKIVGRELEKILKSIIISDSFIKFKLTQKLYVSYLENSFYYFPENFATIRLYSEG